DCGLRLPPSAGSASGVLPNPVGYDRVYVHLDGELSYERWWEALRAGRVFVSNGPLQCFPPPFIAQLPVKVNVNTVVTHRIWQHTGGAASRGRQSQTTVEDVIVNLLCPIPVALRIGKTLLVSRPSPCLIRQHAASVHVLVGNPD